MPSFQTFVNLIAIAIAVFWQPSYKPRKDVEINRYIHLFFLIVWYTLYALITFSIYEFRNSGFSDSYSTSDTTFILIIINIILSKTWMPLFFGIGERNGRMLALCVCIGMLGTSVAILVFMGQLAAWTSFGLWMPYALWNVVATILNILELIDVEKTY
jgi:tryptophan-rich sensory protein